MLHSTVPCCNLASKIAGQSVDHHRLTNYHHAILSIILSQFSPKGLPGGMQGIIKLAQASPYLKVNSHYPHAVACMPEGVSYCWSVCVCDETRWHA